MQRSATATGYIIIKAECNSEWDTCEFAILSITAEWNEALSQRIKTLEQFKQDESFVHLSFWEKQVGFYKQHYDDGDTHIVVAEVLGNCEDWAFVTIEGGELSLLPVPESKLRAHQLIISWDGTIRFKAYGKHTGEEFWTNDIDITGLLV